MLSEKNESRLDTNCSQFVLPILSFRTGHKITCITQVKFTIIRLFTNYPIAKDVKKSEAINDSDSSPSETQYNTVKSYLIVKKVKSLKPHIDAIIAQHPSKCFFKVVKQHSKCRRRNSFAILNIV